MVGSGEYPDTRNKHAEFVDAVVVGSGFGGSVAAYRLANHGKRVVLMERGRSYPPGSFARTPAQFGKAFWDPSQGQYGLFDVWSMRGLEGLVSSGLGGGSLIYANVLLRKDEHWFVHESPLPGGGYEDWPFTRADLDPHYQNVENMIGTTRYPYNGTPKTVAVEAAAGTLGLAVERPPLAVTFSRSPRSLPEPGREIPWPAYGNIHGSHRQTCSLCGECDIGCNTGAKNTLDHTYLSAAAAATVPADIRTLHEVRGFARDDDGTWLVRYVAHDPDNPTRTRDVPEQVIRCAKLILAAGTFGTSYLLLRNRISLPGISQALGTRFCGNGDLLGLMLKATQTSSGMRSPRQLAGSKGPVITTAIRVGDEVDGSGGTGRGYYLQDAGYPSFLNWFMEMSQMRAAIPRVARLAARIVGNRLFQKNRTNISADLAALMGEALFSDCSVPLLGMGRDIPDGTMNLRDGRLAVDWTLATSEDYFARVRDTMRDLADELGADFQDNPLWLAKRVITVHALGGAPMGANSHSGVCDPYSQVFGSPGLYVVDGAAMPGPVGANPSLTIAALADRACERMLEEPWPQHSSKQSRPAARARAAQTNEPEPPSGPVTTVSFTEKMKGHFSLGRGEPEAANNVALLRHERMMFELTITTADMDSFVADPNHPCTASGYLDADMLGGRCEVEKGWFNLLVLKGSGRRLMLYRLYVTSPGGKPLTFVGYKDIHSDKGFDIWPDTTTLRVQMLAGHVPVAEQGGTPWGQEGSGLLDPADSRVLGAGILYIQPLDFARQLTTFNTSGPNGAAALTRFGELFLGSLWDSYFASARTGIAAGPKRRS